MPLVSGPTTAGLVVRQGALEFVQMANGLGGLQVQTAVWVPMPAAGGPVQNIAEAVRSGTVERHGLRGTQVAAAVRVPLAELAGSSERMAQAMRTALESTVSRARRVVVAIPSHDVLSRVLEADAASGDGTQQP